MQEHRAASAVRTARTLQDTPHTSRSFSVRSVSNEFDVLAEKFLALFGQYSCVCVCECMIVEGSHIIVGLIRGSCQETIGPAMQLTFMGFFRHLPPSTIQLHFNHTQNQSRFDNPMISPPVRSQTIHNKLQINRQ